MLTYTRKLTHIKASISVMPIFAMCFIKVQYTILDHVEKAERKFLWYGKDINKHGKCLVKWDTICLPKDAGGLGVLDLWQQNRALLMKKIYKFFSHSDAPWIDLIWKAYYAGN